MITLFFFDYDYDYNNHISWLQSRLRVIKIILEILINNNDITTAIDIYFVLFIHIVFKNVSSRDINYKQN